MYSPRQIQSMQAIGLVPWVRRTAGATPEVIQQADVATAVENTVLEAPQLTPPVPQTSANASDHSTEQFVVCSGDMESSVLLIFDIRNGEGSWPLLKEDDALLQGMLRAIGFSKASVCSCAMLEGATENLSVLCQAPRQYFLYFGGETIAPNTTAPVAMTQAIKDSDTELAGWRLPSLHTLREAPQRKRHAWITLKQLRSALDHN